jgi:CHASE2 domain-containing sensor protein/class 3 adenylate cyclase
MKPHESMRVAVLLFSDLVGSVALQSRVGTQAYSRMLSRHNELFRQAVETEGRGRILNYTGDGFLAELPSPTEAVNAALRFQWLLHREKWEAEKLVARTALHLGEIAEIRQSGEVRHVGMAINQVARLMDLAGGNQILLSRPIWDDARRNVRTHPQVEASRQPDLDWRAHGRYLLKGTDEPLEVFEVGAKGIGALRQPPDSPKAARVADLTSSSALTGATDQRTLRQRLVRPNQKEQRTALIGAGITALVGALLLMAGVFDGISYDLSYLFRSKAAPSDVVMIEMDSASSIQLNQPSDDKWDRRLHAQILQRMKSAGAKAVAFDILFTGPAKNPSEDEAFRAALQQATNIVLGAAAEVSPLGDNSVTIHAPYEPFRSVAKWAVVERSMSGRSLRQPVALSGIVGEFSAMNEMLAQVAFGQEKKAPKGSWFNYYGPPGTIPRRSYLSVLSNEVPASAFSNKVVFIGANTAIGYSGKPGTDYFLSPYSRWSGKEIPGVEVNATSFANLARGDWLRRLSPVLELLAVLMFGALVGYAAVLLQPAHASIFAVATGLIVAVGMMAQVWATRIWFPWMTLCAGELPVALLAASALRPRFGRVASGAKTATAVTPQTQAISRTSAERPAIPDHEPLRCIGHGAYGEVWLARDAIGSFHAVKILRRSAFKEEGPYEREFKGLQRYTPLSRSHPGLVHILHVGRNEAAGYIYYVMEAGDDQRSGANIDGDNYEPRNLATDIGRLGRIPLEQLVEQGIEVAEALAFLHRNRLIHRDIKPANIIFVNGRAKLADIGLVTEIGAPGDEISFIGTEGYIPPEGPGKPAGDVFSLGKSLYVGATGCAVKKFPEIPESLADAPDRNLLHGFMQILLRACEPMVAERFQDAEEMAAALKAFRGRLK